MTFSEQIEKMVQAKLRVVSESSLHKVRELAVKEGMMISVKKIDAELERRKALVNC